MLTVAPVVLSSVAATRPRARGRRGGINAKDEIDADEDECSEIDRHPPDRSARRPRFSPQPKVLLVHVLLPFERLPRRIEIDILGVRTNVSSLSFGTAPRDSARGPS